MTNRKKADVLILPYWKGKKGAVLASSSPGSKVTDACKQTLGSGDFTGKKEQATIIYVEGLSEPRVLLLGLGKKEKFDLEQLRRSFSVALKQCQKCGVQKLNVLPPEKVLDPAQVARGIVEGVRLTDYRFDQLKNTTKKKDAKHVTDLSLIGASKPTMKRATEAEKVCSAVHMTRDLIMGNADDVTPQYLAQLARKMSRSFPKVKTTVFDKKRLEKEKMGLILAVNRGSARPPVLITMQYKGNPRSKDHTIIVGKGITYDTGGLNLKPTGSMENMRKDMSGAACAFGVMQAVASLGLKKNLTIVVPSTENGIDAHSYKPGDVYTGYAGKSVEIGNTDAEGRLVLADALAYATKKLRPTRIIDVATLTGAIIIALGHHTTGLMSNDDKLSEALYEAGQTTYERVWRLPLYQEYRDQIKSEVADLKNTGGRGAGSITAACFLQEFVGDTPWAHFDIAGTSWGDTQRYYHPRFAAGVGVRLLVEFVESLKA